jgi:uncharacterized membrane protein
MNLQNYRAFFIAVTGILALVVASPALSRFLVFPRTEFFTELWLLGPNHKAENYPFNLVQNHNYSVFLYIGNRLGYCAYYIVEVKFRNQTQSAPNSFNHTPSSLPTLYNITAFVADENVWEMPLTFSFNYKLNETLSQIEFYSLTLNNVALDIRSYTATWNSAAKGYFGYLFFELWIYNKAIGDFQYHERFVSLKFNMTNS